MIYTKTLKLLLCAGATLALAACATTATPTADKTAEAQAIEQTEAAPAAKVPLFTIRKVKSANANAEQICKRQDIIGSRFKRTICATEAEWEALASENRDAMKRLMRKSSQQTSGN